MSEQLKNSLILVIFIIACVMCAFTGYEQGRSQQKKLDEAWYAAHPVVLTREVKFYLYENGNLVPDAACGFVSPNPDDNRITCIVSTPAPTPPAKPTSQLKWGDWFYGKHTDYKIATVDPCPLEMHGVGWGWGEVDCESNSAKPAKGSKWKDCLSPDCSKNAPHLALPKQEPAPISSLGDYVCTDPADGLMTCRRAEAPKPSQP